MKDLKGTRTEANLWAAFAGESQARNKYTYFASQAKKEGYEQIAAIFEETADNEKEHAKMFFKYLNGIGNTIDNLKEAAKGEHYEWSEMYKEFARVAKEEGFDDIAATFEFIAKVEEKHEERYNKLISNIENNKVFKKDEKVAWKCRNCGYVHYGDEAPKICPSCRHPQSFFEIRCENY